MTLILIEHWEWRKQKGKLLCQRKCFHSNCFHSSWLLSYWHSSSVSLSTSLSSCLTFHYFCSGSQFLHNHTVFYLPFELQKTFVLHWEDETWIPRNATHKISFIYILYKLDKISPINELRGTTITSRTL